MDLSVVVPTLNGRNQLAACLDSIARDAPDAEVVVVNGPSSDGTSGMVRDRDDVDVLVEVADRNVNVARNAGIEAATGGVIALVGYDLTLEEGWRAAVAETIAEGAAVATGPTHRTLQVGMTTETRETTEVAGRPVTFFNGDNVAFTREAVEAVDGFDEYIEGDGARDASHRLAGLGGSVVWNGEMCVRGEFEADGGTVDRDPGLAYRGFTYRLVKNYGPRPAVLRVVLGRGLADARAATRTALSDEAEPSGWLGSVRATVTGLVLGTKDGLVARRSDRRPCRNPNGLSKRTDRAERTYDWR